MAKTKADGAKPAVPSLPPIVSELARATALQNIQMLRIQAEALPSDSGDVITELTLNLGGNTQKAGPPSQLRCFFAVQITGKSAAPKGKPMARISLVVAAAYQVNDEALFARLSKEDTDAFAGANAIRQVWPYVRELCQSLSLRMGVTPIILPLLSPIIAIGDLASAPAFNFSEPTPAAKKGTQKLKKRQGERHA